MKDIKPAKIKVHTVVTALLLYEHLLHCKNVQCMQLKNTFHVDRGRCFLHLVQIWLRPAKAINAWTFQPIPCSTVYSVTSHLSHTFVEALSTPFYAITKARSGSEVLIQ